MKESVESVHKLFNNSPNLVSFYTDKGGALHYAVSGIKSPKIVAYILCRGQNVTIEGINCSKLSPMNLHLQNSAGETAIDLAEIELLKLAMSADIDQQISIKLINDFIDLAMGGHFKEIAHKMDNYQATYNTKKNMLLTQPEETDITKDPTNPKVKFEDDEQLSHIKEITMPHYPSFDKDWREQDVYNSRAEFINAYKENNFPAMQDTVLMYNIQFKGDDTISSLAYEAMDKGCFKMTDYLVKQGCLSMNHIPEGKTKTLEIKYNMEKAKMAVDNTVKTGLVIKLKRSTTSANLQDIGNDEHSKKKNNKKPEDRSI